MSQGNRQPASEPPQGLAESPPASFIDWLSGVVSECGFDRHSLMVRRGRTAYSQGEIDEAIYLVETGVIAHRVRGASGRSCVIATFEPGEVFGEECLRGPGPRCHTAVAMQDSQLLRVPAAAISARLTCPGVFPALIRHMLLRLAESQAQIVALLSYTTEQRLAWSLVRLTRPVAGGTGQSWAATPSFTQSDLSSMVGTTRCRVGHFLKRFRALGLVRPDGDGSFRIDTESLLDYANDSRDRRRTRAELPAEPRRITVAQGGHTKR